MCLLPPQCLFCRHFDLNAGPGDADCAAFAEIPDAIFRGQHDHGAAFPGDGGIRFALNPELAGEFAEINALRTVMGLPPFAAPRAARRAAG